MVESSTPAWNRAPAGESNVRALLLAGVQTLFKPCRGDPETETAPREYRNLTLAHRSNNLVQRPVILLIDKREEFLN